MNRPYIIGISTFLVVTSAVSYADEWEDARQNFQTSINLKNNDNLFNTHSQQNSSNITGLGFAYDWLGLYEGFGLHTPLQVQRAHYSKLSSLNHTDYQFAPALKLFINPATELVVQTQWRAEQLLAGEGNAEYLDPNFQAIEHRHKELTATLQIGQAPDVQNLKLIFGHQDNQQQLAGADYHSLIGSFVQAEYGHKVSENTALLLTLEARQEKQQQQDSDLLQYAVGFSSHWTGQQKLKFLFGQFNRAYGQAIASTKGTFWELSNLWRWSEQWQLDLGSSRRSLLSYAINSISQQDTRYSAELQYQYDQSHQMKLAFEWRKAELDQQSLLRKNQLLGLGWNWQFNSQWRSEILFKHALQQDNQQTDRQRNEASMQVSWLW